jgi:hypothetical protein
MLMLALGLTGTLTPLGGFSWFSRSSVFIMFSSFGLAEGLHHSWLTGGVGFFIIKLVGKRGGT